MEPDLGEVLRMARSFAASQLLLTAVQLGVFTTVAQEPVSAQRLQEKLELHPRSARDFFDALVAHGLLVRDGEMYRNSEVAQRHLDERKTEEYLGGFLTLTGGLYWLWPNLATCLRTGGPITMGGGGQWDGEGEQDRAPAESSPEYFAAMATFARTLAPGIAGGLDWNRYESFVDLGGSTGVLAAHLVTTHSHLRGTCFDLPDLKPHFDKMVAELGVTGRVDFAGGDFFADDLPATDVVILGHILHNWSPERRVELLRRVFAALRPGGAVLVFDPMIDEQRLTGREALMSSLDQLLFSEGGGEYTFADLSGWLATAGFRDHSAHPLSNGAQTLAIATKPS